MASKYDMFKNSMAIDNELNLGTELNPDKVRLNW